MHTPSTRILSALAYDRGEEYDPARPDRADLLEALSLIEQARPVIGEDGPYERARRRRRERRSEPYPGVVLGAGSDRRAVGSRRAPPRRARLLSRGRTSDDDAAVPRLEQARFAFRRQAPWGPRRPRPLLHDKGGHMPPPTPRSWWPRNTTRPERSSRTTSSPTATG